MGKKNRKYFSFLFYVLQSSYFNMKNLKYISHNIGRWKYNLWSNMKLNCHAKLTVCVRNYSSNMPEVRVRFAPSPTGQLHIGGLRSALYNHLFAKSKGGKFILRIEDTDQTRLVAGATEKLCEMLHWAGIHVHEGPEQGGPCGPYIQSERKHIYQEMIQTLLQNESAYPCFCTTRRLNLLRKDQRRMREVPKYDNLCRSLSQEERQEKLDLNVPYVVRFKLTPHKEAWQDLVYGPIVSDVASIEGDPVLMKTDGFPTYHLANVVDDHMMKITHVLRGVEWQVSTTKHLLLYSAFGWTPPEFGHLPLLLNKHGKKLSKREDDIHVEHIKTEGYEAEALQTFMCSMGSGFTLEQKDIMNTDGKDLSIYFDLSKMNTNSTKLEFERLELCNRNYLRSCLAGDNRSQLVTQVRNTVQEIFQDRADELDSSSLEEDYIINVLDWCLEIEQITVIKDLVNADFEFLWLNTSAMPGNVNAAIEACEKHTPREILEVMLDDLEKLDHSKAKNTDLLREHYKDLVKSNSLPMKEFMTCVRCVLFGQKTGPSVAELVRLLGRERSKHRIHTVLKALDNNKEAETKQL